MNEPQGFPVLNFFLKRIALALLTLWGVSILCFIIIQLPPGDFVTSYMAQLQATGNIVSYAEIENLRDQYGLNQAFVTQYSKWFFGLLRGDLGYSLEWHLPVQTVIGDHLILTLALSLATLIFITVFSFLLGVLGTLKKTPAANILFSSFIALALAFPGFLLGLIVMYFGYQQFHILIGGLISDNLVNASWSLVKIKSLLVHLPLPAIILGLGTMAYQAKLLRSNIMDELGKNYVLVARAKGLSEFRVITKHPLRVSLNSFVSLFGYLLPEIISSGVPVSLVMGLPTLGPLLYKALLAQDMYLAGAIILILSSITIAGTFLSDILIAWLDPRVRAAQSAEGTGA